MKRTVDRLSTIGALLVIVVGCTTADVTAEPSSAAGGSPAASPAPSRSLTPTIPPTAPPARNDDAPGIDITVLPFTDTTNTSSAHVDAIEPGLCGAPGQTVWYHFTAPQSATVIADTFGSDFDTVVSVWRGTMTRDALGSGVGMPEPLACNDDHGDLAQSEVVFEANAGQSYAIQVGTAEGSSGGTLTFHLAIGTDDARTPTPTIPPRPVNDDPPGTDITVVPFADSTNTLRANVGAIEPGLCGAFSRTVWYSFTAAETATMVADTIGTDYDTVLSVWHGPMTNEALVMGVGMPEPLACNTRSSSLAQSEVVFEAIEGQTYAIQVGAGEGSIGGSLTFNLAISGDAARTPTPTIPGRPINDNPPGIDITAMPFTDTTNNTRAAIHAMETSNCGSLHQSVWYSFLAQESATLVADTFGSTFDTVLEIWQGSLTHDFMEPGFENLVPLACNDNAAGTTQSEIVFAAVRGQHYVIRVASHAEAVGGALVFRLQR